jgi:hypothetical protein
MSTVNLPASIILMIINGKSTVKICGIFIEVLTNFTPEKNDRANTPDVLHSVDISTFLLGFVHNFSCKKFFFFFFLSFFSFLSFFLFFFAKLGFSLCCTKLDIYKLTL